MHVAQGFEAVQGTLNAANRQHIETNLLRNMSRVSSEGSPETFNRVHNHGTWATAAVGMTGYALGDKDYVEKGRARQKARSAAFSNSWTRYFRLTVTIMRGRIINAMR